jgi:hypothetical protein
MDELGSPKFTVVVVVGKDAPERRVRHPDLRVAEVVARPVERAIPRRRIAMGPPRAVVLHHGALQAGWPGVNVMITISVDF